MAVSRTTTRAVTLAAIIILLAVASVSQAEEDEDVLATVRADIAAAIAYDREVYECRLLGTDKVILTLLTVPDVTDESEWFSVTLRGRQLDAAFMRTGLDYRWIIDGDRNYQIILEPTMIAGYYDFTGVEEGEREKPETVFECELVEGAK